MSQTISAPPAGRRGGRPRNAAKPECQARFLRWYIVHHLCGQSMEAIGRGESPPVDRSVVSRGIAAARPWIVDVDLLRVMGRLGFEVRSGAVA